MILIAAAEPEGGDAGARTRIKKAPNAFRTISEVADELHIPQHVLRFWESKFAQVRPLKRGGGRRYYRPDDIQLLRRIANLLYTQGYTIKGVQRLLREGGGRLDDDIPPAPPAERERAEVDGPDEPAPEQGDLHLLAGPECVDLVAEQPAASSPPGGDAELLRSLLGELEALRALLP